DQHTQVSTRSYRWPVLDADQWSRSRTFPNGRLWTLPILNAICNALTVPSLFRRVQEQSTPLISTTWKPWANSRNDIASGCISTRPLVDSLPVLRVMRISQKA